MEASNVLKEYLELFTADCRQLKLLVAPNAAVDWFGRTVRGPAKIHDYFRFDFEFESPLHLLKYKYFFAQIRSIHTI